MNTHFKGFTISAIKNKKMKKKLKCKIVALLGCRFVACDGLNEL